MRLNHRFRRLVFAQIVLGIVAFCIAEPNPGMLLIAGALAVLSWYVTEGPSGRPLPRWTINLGSLLAVAWLMFDLFGRTGNVVVSMGHFTMWLQVLLLYTDKSNREYGQLLVLSLMTMIGASILSISMIYGVLLAAYCILGLVTLLHFHFKATLDGVAETMKEAAPVGATVIPPKPTIGRGYAWHLRFAVLAVGFVCTSVAVAVFVATPRREDAAFQTPDSNPLTRKQTGFSESVNLRSGAPGEGNQEPVLNMSVSLHEQSVEDPMVFLLRGASLDKYDEKTKTWTRSFEATALDRSNTLPRDGWRLPNLKDPETTQYEARVTLRQSGFRVLFTAFPTTYIASENFSSVIYNELDGQFSAAEVVPGAVIYTLRWPWQGSAGVDLPDPAEAAATLVTRTSVDPETGRGEGPAERQARRQAELADKYAAGWPSEGDRKRIEGYARGVLQQAGVTLDGPESHARVVRALEEHLRNSFEYSLENPAAPAGSDPVTEFLFNHRKGHCELFASGLAAMTRAVGLRARVITGYRASEYNRVGGYYVVRQDDAHAWTEVFVGGENGGWRTYDSTPPDAVSAEHAVNRGWFTYAREVYEAIEYEWIRSVVAYDQRTRDAVMEEIKASVGTPAERGTWLGRAWDFVRNLRDIWAIDKLNYTLIFVILIMISIGVASLARTMIVRRRRLVALQLTALPRAKRRGLASKLRFYLTMLDMLERYGYVRPAWQSPFAFAQELAEANPMRFDPVLSLTEVFYEIRFGHRDLDARRKTRIKAHLKQLEHALAGT